MMCHYIHATITLFFNSVKGVILDFIYSGIHFFESMSVFFFWLWLFRNVVMIPVLNKLLPLTLALI